MSLVDQTAEFFANLVGYGHSPGSTISAVLGACLSGLTCGALGSFIIMRRMSLFADMLGHAVLPGVAIGFILAGSKSTPALLLGSLAAGLLAALLTRAISSHSRIKEKLKQGIAGLRQQAGQAAQRETRETGFGPEFLRVRAGFYPDYSFFRLICRGVGR